jgi:hypothetical protein
MPDTQVEDQLKARIRDLELALGQGNTNLAVTFRLTPVLNNLMGLLLALPVVTPEMIRQRLDIAPDAKVAVHRLRTHMKPWLGEEFIKSKRNVGYWIEGVDKSKVKAMLVANTDAADAPVETPETHAEIEIDSGPEDDLLQEQAA